MRKVGFHLLFSAIFTILLILPDMAFHALHPSYGLVVNLKEIEGLFALAFFILMIRSVWVRFVFFTVLMLFSLSELANFAYFGTLISPYGLLKLVSEAHDIGESFVALFGYIYAPFLLIGMIVGPVFLLLLRYEQKLEGRTLSVPYIGVILALLLAFGPFRAHRDESSYLFQPKLDSYAVKNFYTAVSLLIGKELPQRLGLGTPPKVFAPYRVVPIADARLPQTIVVVMGESLGYPRMSLFGFPLETTPTLTRLVTSGKVTARKAISSGVQTDVSVPSFFTLKREPENTAPLYDTTTNLFRLAKEHGYTTHYISAQTSGILGGYLGKYADVVITKENFEQQSDEVVYDQVLVDYLAKIDYTKRNFIVLHQRNSHGPYDKYTPKAFNYFPFDKNNFADFTLKTYANSVRYTDYLLGQMIATLDRRATKGYMFFATSDHGELMGEGGRYGHAQLYFDVSKVPFLFAHQGGAAPIVAAVAQSRDGITHYEIGKIIAKALGYEVVNPNDHGECFLNGVDINGRGGSLTFRPDKLPSKL